MEIAKHAQATVIVSSEWRNVGAVKLLIGASDNPDTVEDGSSMVCIREGERGRREGSRTQGTFGFHRRESPETRFVLLYKLFRFPALGLNSFRLC
jgi:hypothetical protein